MIKLFVFFNSMLFTIGIIGGIGPQNTNLISHAIQRNHHYWVGIVSFSEVILTLFGCIGFGHEKSKLILTAVNIAGALFLIYYLYGKIKSLSQSKQCQVNQKQITRRSAILKALGLIWFNPIVYVDTLILIGGNSTNYCGIQHVIFIMGCLCGYCVWKFGVPAAVGHYSHSLNKPVVWKSLDIATIIMVSYVLVKLIFMLSHSIAI